jgi:acyl-CoA dehydrogenase
MSTLTNLRQRYISDPAFKMFKKVLPPLSDTEREAMEAGSVWWDGELFSGSPNWNTLLTYPKPKLTDEEQTFIDTKLETLLEMLNDYEIVQEDKDLSPEVWTYLRKEKFFSLIISKEYGGLNFSALANSTIVTKIATRSLSAAVSVMVPNSLGPGELLSHYGTQEQKDYWLPRLAHGEEVPCFALTGPEAGSDAGGIPDMGVVCYGEHQGKEVLGIKVSWNKRYITLAPVATVLGLAFKLQDPDGLIGDKTDIGITCALIPADHQGVEIGERHDPLNMAFMNGPTRGQDVFIPMDWVIGGQEYVGRGWRMLVECLSAGRGISLPALGAAIGHLTARTTGAYSYVRKQFGMSIGNFEGVAQAMGRIGGYTYMLEASRMLTTTSLDQGEIPGIVTAIAKYHMTEMARTILNDLMDIHAGRAIQLGPLVKGLRVVTHLY